MDPLLLQLGLIILLAFVGAAIAQRYGHSLMIAYILVGIIIGPYGPLPWKLVTEGDLTGGTSFVPFIAKVGLVLLMFFVGLEFYPSKLKDSGPQAAVLAVADIGITMFIGFAVCTWLGMGLIDTIFYSCIIAMSSVAVTMKALEELGWTGRKATEVLVGMMVIEDFAFIIILTLGNSFIFESGSKGSILVVLGSIAVFLTFFLVLILIFVPNALSHIEKVQHEELFVLLALAAVFLSAAMAESFGLSAFIGSFFIGVAFAETKLAPRLKEKTVSFRDAFVAIFFVSFGMMIDPRGIMTALPLLGLVVPLVLAGEILVCASVAYLMGNSSNDSMIVGGGTSARSEEAVIFANMGGSLKDSAGKPVLGEKGGSMIYPFTGAFCLIMSSVTPTFIKKSGSISKWFASSLPCWLTRSGKSLQEGVGAVMAKGGNAVGFAAGANLTLVILQIVVSPTVGRLDDSEPFLATVTRTALIGATIAAAVWLFIAIKTTLAGSSVSRGQVIFTAAFASSIAACAGIVVFIWGFSYALACTVALCLLIGILAACWQHGRGETADGAPLV